MRLPTLTSLSLFLLLAVGRADAAPLADEFFHAGAQSYLSNNIPLAKEEVTNGLKLYPDDIKLKKLEELLNQQQQSQQSQDSQQNQQDQQPQKSDQPDKKNEPKPQDKKDSEQNQSPKDEPKKSADKPKPAEQKKSEGKSGDQPEPKPGPGRQLQPAQMTPQQAQRLLDSQKGSEQVLWFKPEGKPEDPSKPVKDW